MPTVAQGILKTTTIAKQTGLGVPNVTASAGQILRRVTHVPTYDRNTYVNNEITPDQQDRGISYGLKKTASKLSGLLSSATYKLLMQACMRQNFTAGVSISAASITIAGASPYTLTRAAGNYLTDGFKVGDVIQLSVGTFNAANISKNFLITALTATVATGIPVNGVAMVAEGPITGSTVSVIGKKTFTPLTGQTNDYFTIEDWYADVAKSDLFSDFKVNKMDIKLPATGNCTADFDLVGLNRTIAASQQMATPTAVTGTAVLTAVNGDLYVNGVAFGACTGMTIAVDNGVSLAEAIVGSNAAIDLNRGTVKVSGSFTGLFTDQSIQTIYTNETPIGIIFVAAADTTANSAFMSFVLGRCKLTSDSPDDGQKMIVRTYNFTSEINLAAGGTGTAYDATILAIQDSGA